MPSFSAGEASIKVSPNLRSFVRETRAELRAMDLSAEVKLQPQTGVALAELEKFRREAQRPVEMRIGAETAEATAAVDRWRLEQEANHVNLKVDVDRSSTSSVRNGLRKLAEGVGDAATINLKVVGVLGAGAAVADLLAIADAAAQASHMLALLPAVGLGGLAGAGSLAVGLHGIPDAFKALSSASGSSAQTAIQQRDALNAVSEAQYKVGQAQRAVGQSDRQLRQDQDALTDAYKATNRSIRDTNLSLDEQKLNVSDASIAVSEAAKNLQRVQFDPTADSDARRQAMNDYQRAVLSYQQAQNKANDLAQDTAEANAKGVEGSKAVIDAKQKIVDDTAAEADAVHNLQQAYYDLSKAQQEQTAGGAQGKINEAFAKLSPNAQLMVRDIQSLGPAWTEARKAAQDALTEGVGSAIVRLSDVQLPNLRAGMVGIDHELNTGLRATIEALSTDTAKVDFRTFLDNTTAGFHGLAQAAGPATQAFTTLATVGSEQFPALGKAIDDAAVKFDRLILTSSADGRLREFIEGGIESGRELARVAEHVGSAVGSIFHAAGDNGQALKSLDDLTGRMATFLKSAQGQEELGKFFAELRQDGQNLVPLLQTLPGLLEGVIGGFRAWSAIATPFLQAAAKLLSDHPRLVEAAVAAYLGFKTVGPVLDGAKLAIDGLAARAGYAASEAGGVGKFKAAGQGLLGIMGNPWTIGLAAAGAATLAFVDEADKASAAVNRFSSETQGAVAADRALEKALASSGGALDQGVLAAQANKIQYMRDLLEQHAKDAPSLLDQINLAPAVYGAPFGVGQGIIANEKTRIADDNFDKKTRDALNSLGLANDQLAAKITGSKPEFDAMIDRLSDMGDGGREAASKLSGLRDEWGLDAAAASGAAQAIKDLGDRNKDATDSIDAATAAIEHQRHNATTLEDAQVAANGVILDMKNNADSMSGAVVSASGALDGTTNSSKALYSELHDRLAPAYTQVVTAAYNSARQQGQTSEEAQVAAKQAGDGIWNSAQQQIMAMGYTQNQADTLLQHYLALPKNISTQITADTSQAEQKVKDYQALLDGVATRLHGLPTWMQLFTPGITGDKNTPGLATPGTTQQNPNVAPYYQYLPGATPGGLTGHAVGGLIVGPGNGTSDSILSRVSNGEFISRAASVKKYGAGFYQALNAGTIDPKALPGFADGGLVDPNDPTKQPPGFNSQTVTYPQAQLPAPMTDQQIQVLQSQSAVDAANSERNRVYSDPNSTAQDKRAADLKYLQSQNQLKSAQEQTGSGALPKQYTVPGIASRFAGVLAQGVLDSLGLGQSVLSDSSVYAGDFQKVGDYLQKQGNGTGAPGYNYTPQNLPSTITTYTPPAVPQGSAGGGPSLSDYAGQGTSTYNPTAGVEQWRPLATQVLIREGFNPGQVDIMLAQIQSESGGNPSIIQQVHDVNSGGNEAVGLLQVIPGTFEAYRDPSLPDDRTNPEANMVAALRYYRARYGSDLSTMWGQGHGYADGGLIGGIGGGRSDNHQIWASAGEYIVNAYDTARNLPLLEAINSSQWNPVAMPTLSSAAGQSNAAPVTRDHSVNIAQVSTLNVDDLIQKQNRWQEQQSMGALAVYS